MTEGGFLDTNFFVLNNESHKVHHTNKQDAVVYFNFIL